MRKRLASQEGAAILEFAIVLPLLLLLVFGIIEFGIILYNQQVISNASREAARYAIVQPANGTLHSTSNIQQVVMDYCNNNLINFGGSSLTTAVKDAGTGGNLNTAANVCSSIATPDKDIQVEVSYVYNFLVYHSIAQLFGAGAGSTTTFTAYTTMRCEATS